MSAQLIPAGATTSPAAAESEHGPANLWEKALAMLDEDFRRTLDFNHHVKLDILAKTLATAEEKRQLCRRKRWKVKIKGKEVVLRDVVEKIMECLCCFKDVGSAASSLEPMYAALPWAGVQFLLKIALKDSSVFGSTVSGLETVSHLVTQYAEFERAYMQRATHGIAQIEPLLTSLYAEILMFLAKAKKYFQMPTGVRILKSALVEFQSDEDKQLTKIARLESKLSAAAALSDGALLNIVPALELRTQRIADQIAEHAKIVDDTRYREVVDWLSPIPWKAHHDQQSERRLPGSGQWLLHCHQFVNWRTTSSSSMFLVRGMAGSGKTTLASIVVDSFLSKTASAELAPDAASSVLLAHFYCSKMASEAKRRDPTEVMRSILRQLAVMRDAQRTIHRLVLTKFEERVFQAKADGFDVPRLKLNECVALILAISRSDPMTLVIDAIDEVPPANRYQLVQSLDQIVRESPNVVKIFLTSRDDDQVLALLKDVTTVRVDVDNNSSDLKRFVEDRVADAKASRRLLGGDISEGMEAALMKALTKCAGECFQLVIWQIDKLCETRHESDLRAAMQRLSGDTLERLYGEMLSKIRTADAHAGRIATRAISLLLRLREPLPPASFLRALRTPDELGASHTDDGPLVGDSRGRNLLTMEQVLRICFHLIIEDSKVNVMRFAHTSVHDYLEQQVEFDVFRTETEVSRTCLESCLYSSSVELDPQVPLMNSFYHYGALYWADHCKIAFQGDQHDNISDLVSSFVFDDDGPSLVFQGWLEDVRLLAELLPRHHSLKRPLSAIQSHDHSPAFTLCVFGLHETLSLMLPMTTFNGDAMNEEGQTGLYLACALGHQHVVGKLLDHGVDANRGEGRLGSPLQAACFEGHDAIVGMLVDKGANMKSQVRFSDAVQAAIEGGQESVALLLFNKGFTIVEQGEFDSILLAASQSGLAKVVDCLHQAHGLKFTDAIEPSDNQRAIRAAILKGHVSVLDRFIRSLEHPYTKLPADSVALAAQGGHNNMVSLLLSKGIDIEYEGRFGRPLRTASLFGFDSTVDHLINKGAFVDASSSTGNALEAAAFNGHLVAVQALLRHGANPNIDGGSHKSPLQAAAYRGHTRVTLCLLDAGAGDPKDAFHAAVQGGHENLVQILFERGFRPTRLPKMVPCSGSLGLDSDRSCYAPECYMQFHGFPSEECTLLELAASKGQEQSVQMILHSQRMTGRELSITLRTVSRNGYERIADWILDEQFSHWTTLKKEPSLLFLTSSTAGEDDLYLARIRDNMLLPGCIGNQASMVIRSLRMMRQRATSSYMTAIRNTLLNECTKHDSYTVIEYLLETGNFGREDLLAAVMRSCEHGSVNSLAILLSFLRKKDYDHDNREVPVLTSLTVHRAKPPEECCLFDAIHLGFRLAASNGHFGIIQSLLKDSERNGVVCELLSPRKTRQRLMHLCGKGSVYETAFEGALHGSSERDPGQRCRPEQRAVDREKRILIIAALLDHGALGYLSEDKVIHMFLLAVEYCPQKSVEAILDKVPSLLGTKSPARLALQTVLRRKMHADRLVMRLLLAGGCPLDKFSFATLDPDLSFWSELLDQALQSLPWCDPMGPMQHTKHILESGPAEVIKSLLRCLPTKRTDSEDYAKLLWMSAAVDDRAWLQLLLERGLNINRHPNIFRPFSIWDAAGRSSVFCQMQVTALHCAAEFGHVGVVEFLLQCGADPIAKSSEGISTLEHATSIGSKTVVDLLLRYRPEISAAISPAILTMALKSRDPTIFDSLVAARGEIHWELDDERALLVQACEVGAIDIVRTLLESGFEINLPRDIACGNSSYWLGSKSPLHEACVRGHLHVVQALTRGGADLESEIQGGRTPLWVATYASHLPVVKYLIDAGADIEHYTSEGTALIQAVSSGVLSVVEELLLAGATVIDNFGRWNALALAHANTWNRRDLVELILDHVPEHLLNEGTTAGMTLEDDRCSMQSMQ